jgi:hypothetical protein
MCISLKHLLVAPIPNVSELCGDEVKFTILTLQEPVKAVFRRHFAKIRHTKGFTDENALILPCLSSTLFVDKNLRQSRHSSPFRQIFPWKRETYAAIYLLTFDKYFHVFNSYWRTRRSCWKMPGTIQLTI